MSEFGGKPSYDGKRSRSVSERRSAANHARVTEMLFSPTKRELRDMLADAVRNTPKLPPEPEGETDATDH